MPAIDPALLERTATLLRARAAGAMTAQAQAQAAGGASVERLQERLAAARERTLALVAPVAAEDLDRVHSPLMSPIAWDLGHIAAFEELWICQRAGGLRPLRRGLMRVYDADETPRARRGELPYLRAADALEHMRAVRARSLAAIERLDLAGTDPLARAGYVVELVVQHELQHCETVLQALKLAAPGVLVPERRPLPPAPAPARDAPAMVRVEAGPCAIGAGAGGFAYDNERPRHVAATGAYEIDRTPVTNGDYARFVDAGGYRRRELWSAEGWAWRERERWERPLFWTADGRARSYERVEPLDPLAPVMHVSWYEADAYARWAGKRLPTEVEWEKAATWTGSLARERRHPWGEEPPGPQHANLDAAAYGPAPAGAYPLGASPCGALGTIGDCWEWTASELAGYPGFRAFPYRQYSEAFFATGMRVLRGGSWATHAALARATFRNWDHPQRRQLFAGFRCARDVSR